MNKFFLSFLLVGFLCGAGFWIYSANRPVGAAEGQNPFGGGGAMPVETVTIEPEAVQVWKRFSGRLVAVDQADIRPQVSGRITEIRFEDGQHVDKGDILLVIDPRPYQAALNQAKATLAASQTRAELAEKEYQRAQELIKTEAIAQRLLDERLHAHRAAAAAVQEARAQLASARVDLDYAYVKAPIAGKISRAEITEGNLVEAGGNAPLLTSIVSDAHIYADFEVDDQTYLNSVRAAQNDPDYQTPVRLQLDSDDIEYAGHVHSFDNRIDRASGTIRARALFENKDKALLPGMSVDILMGTPHNENQIVVTERAIGTDQNRKFVYIIEDGQSAYREVKLGDSVNGKRIILSGLEGGETVISEGIVRIRPGMPVMPKPPGGQAPGGATPPEGMAPPPDGEAMMGDTPADQPSQETSEGE